ncbi:MAG: hypothetical protein V4655_01670 [Bdellovibrionota bacterium]|nr:MAG: hypothetical protein EOP10_06085 [Pseudomonadota bacterium]
MVLSENVKVPRAAAEPAVKPQRNFIETGLVAIDVFVGGVEQTETDRFIENLLQAYVSRHGTEAIAAAKEQFFLNCGKIFAEDDNYHQRIYYFLNHFIFERGLSPTVRATPFLEYLETAEGSTTPVDGFTHSLFKITKIKSDHLFLKDLLSEKKIRVDKQIGQVFEGIEKNDVFQGFLLHQAAQTVLSRGLIFHPARSHKIIANLLKQERKAQKFGKDQLLRGLAKTQLKHTRLKHVDPKLVYLENPMPVVPL